MDCRYVRGIAAPPDDVEEVLAQLFELSSFEELERLVVREPRLADEGLIQDFEHLRDEGLGIFRAVAELLRSALADPRGAWNRFERWKVSFEATSEAVERVFEEIDAASKRDA